jgi:mannose-6-phosphate isomerase-like protein (cupin superfamily)
MIETIKHNQKIMAILIPGDFQEKGVHFCTPDSFSQQLAYLHHEPGHNIETHFHNPVPRAVTYTNEVLFIKKGKIRVDLYDEDQHYLESRILQAGDVILLAGGGHGFEILEEVEMIEVKQGPYAGEKDKGFFAGVSAREIKIRGRTNV